MFPPPQVPDVPPYVTQYECRIQQSSSSTSFTGPLTTTWGSPIRWAMVHNDRLSLLDDDMLEHLQYEAQRRGVTVEEIYQEEIAARAELDRITPRNADLLAMADRSPAPQAWYDE